MSIAALAVRLATVYALRGKTLAGNAVADSPQNPLPQKLQGVQIAVFTGKHTESPDASDLIGGDQAVDLSIHMHSPGAVDVTDGTTTHSLEAGSGGVGIVFDLMWRQVVRCLMYDPGPWAEIWRTLVVKIGDVESEPFLIEANGGVRVQARDITMTVDTLCDPPFGAIEPGSVWAKLVEAMRAEPELAGLAGIVEHEITDQAELPEWARSRVSLGLTEAELAATGLAPLTTGMEPATAFEVVVDDGTDFTVDASSPEPGALP